MPIGVSGAIALGGAALSAGATIYSSSKQAGAVDKATDAANARSEQAIAETKDLFAPYSAAGVAGNNQYADLLGVNGPDAASKAMTTFQTSPGYGYQVDQGLRAVDAGAAAKGMLRSGATLKAEQTLGSNLANQDFGNYLGRLNTLATNGLAATNSYANVLSGQATQQQQSLVSQGANDASIYGNQAKGVTSAIGNSGLFNANGPLNSLFNPATANVGNSTGYVNQVTSGLGMY